MSSFSEVPATYKYSTMQTASVLERSFVMLPGVGRRTERSLWQQGISNWDAFLEAQNVRGMSIGRFQSLMGQARMLRDLEAEGRLRELGALLPSGERWRLLRFWDSRFAAMDIEVVRAGRGIRPVMVSLLRGRQDCVTLIRGDDLNWRNLGRLLSGVDFLVTFNGSSFDLPVLIDNGFPAQGPMQIDLRRYSARSGLTGGLKRIEVELGIRRSRELEFSTSGQVSYLWRLWEERGSKNALDLLISYNRYDTITLVRLAEEIYLRLSRVAIAEGYG